MGSGAGWGQWMENPQLKEIQGDPASRIPLAHCVSSAGLDLKQRDSKNFKKKNSPQHLRCKTKWSIQVDVTCNDNSTSLEISKGYTKRASLRK